VVGRDPCRRFARRGCGAGGRPVGGGSLDPAALERALESGVGAMRRLRSRAQPFARLAFGPRAAESSGEGASLR